jgi:predicted AlkP superfamily phosphohydrolase/phosphomutase/Tfp pilus assembly protein PilF
MEKSHRKDTKLMKRKVLLIGWDAADWNIINPLLDKGKMPALQQLIDNGCMGNITSLEPSLSPILWTSIATGKTGDKHGILGFTETDNISKAVLPIMSTSRKTKAIWNILQQNGYKTHQVGWWASYPPEKLNGIVVSDIFGKTHVENGKITQSQIDSVYPYEYKELFNRFKISPFDITGNLLKPFVPELSKVDQENDKRLIFLAEALAESSNYHAAATWILEHEEWDFLTVYQKSIDTICHRFMKYYPPKLDFVSQQDFDLYQHVVESIYLFHDMMLDRLLKLAGKEATVILVSDHGFISNEERMVSNPKEPAAISYDHRPLGVFCIKGPGIKKDERIFGASLLDVAPTILSLCQLPLGKDMDGKPLQQIFEKPVANEYIDSWDDMEGDSGMISSIEGDKKKHFGTKEELQQLIDLGYIEDLGDDIKTAYEKSNTESKFNLGSVYAYSGKFHKATEVFEDLASQFPFEPRYKIRLASTYQRIGKHEKSQQIIEELKKLEIKQKEVSSNKKKTKWPVPLYVVRFLEGNNFLAQGKPEKALTVFEKLEKEIPHNSRLYIQKAKAYMALMKYKTAQKEYEKCLRANNENIAAWIGLANCYIIDKKYEDAANAALTTIGLSYFYPRAHFILGFALFHMHDYKNAAQALEVCLVQNNGYTKARNLLVFIYKNHLKNEETLKKHLNYFNQSKKDTIYIVSGIPRSGTSLMMQILESAGLPILTDNKRAADNHNPNGYYEFEKTKRIANDISWLYEAKGKAVKIVSQLLLHLPDDLNYKIIFMQRDLKEVILSQQRMISDKNKATNADAYPVHLEIAYKKNLKRVTDWQNMKSNVGFLAINYNQLLKNPDKELSGLIEFLGLKSNIETLKKNIDVTLYRSKISLNN